MDAACPVITGLHEEIRSPEPGELRRRDRLESERSHRHPDPGATAAEGGGDVQEQFDQSARVHQANGEPGGQVERRARFNNRRDSPAARRPREAVPTPDCIGELHDAAASADAGRSAHARRTGMTLAPREPGRIITFYSYKGGTGRSMALANVAWILASNGYRVLVVDWDLEAPGLHRYFSPFLLDPDLVESDGVIDIVSNYVTALMTPPAAPICGVPAADSDRVAELRKLVALLKVQQSRVTSQSPTRTQVPAWLEPYTDVLRYATSLTWRFPPHEGRQGWIDFIPAGRQGPSYRRRMNAFNWQNFYDRLGGGGFIEALKQRIKEEVPDFALIDSRTGVSDTAGVCTVQLPEVLAVCFTLNRQSIEGASAVAAATRAQRDGIAESARSCGSFLFLRGWNGLRSRSWIWRTKRRPNPSPTCSNTSTRTR